MHKNSQSSYNKNIVVSDYLFHRSTQVFRCRLRATKCAIDIRTAGFFHSFGYSLFRF